MLAKIFVTAAAGSFKHQHAHMPKNIFEVTIIDAIGSR
jgi:hypothetical protein